MSSVRKSNIARTPITKTSSTYSEMELKGFAGLNNKYSNVEIADTESPDCLNVEFDAVGAISKRKGYTPALSFPRDGQTIYSMIPYYGATSHLLVTSGTSIYDATQGTPTPATWSVYNVDIWNSFSPTATWNGIETYMAPHVITQSLNASGARFSAAIDTPHQKLYMVNGNSADGLMSWDGTTFTKNVSTTSPVWTANTAYTAGQTVSNGGNIYKCTVAGTSASSGGPAGTGTSITDGTVTWSYYAPLGYVPNGKYLLYYKNHLYMAGDPNAPYRLYMSDQGDPTSWPVLNYIDFPDGTGGITGLAQLGDSIVVFKEQGVFILKGSDPSNYVVVDTFAGQHGAVSHWSIVRIPNGLVYLARDGVWLFDGKKFELISDKIQGSVNNWNQQQLQNAVAFEYDHKYWLSVPEGLGQNTNNYTYVFNYLYGWWTRYNIPMQSCVVYTNPNPIPYFADANGNIFQAENGDSDNGAAIDAYFVTKAYDFGTPAHMKAFKGVLVTALAQTGNYNLNVTFIEDFGLQSKTVQMPLSYTQASQWGVMTWGKDPWGGYSEVVHLTTNLPGQVRYLQFKIEQPDANAPFTFLSFTVRYKVKRRLA